MNTRDVGEMWNRALRYSLQHTSYNNIRVNVFKMAHEKVNNPASQTIFISNNAQDKIEISRQITERSVFYNNDFFKIINIIWYKGFS